MTQIINRFQRPREFVSDKAHRSKQGEGVETYVEPLARNNAVTQSILPPQQKKPPDGGFCFSDILRMNDFCVEVKVTHQHWEEQDGSGWKWWERCSFEAFRDKFVREAEQNRALQIRLGQEIANRTRQYFHDYLEDISADIPGVESWKEPFSDEVHYRWRPQKDCFYIDGNIDDYLREVYEFVRK